MIAIPIFGDITIAISKDNKIDKMSANLLCLFYTNQHRKNDSKTCTTLESKIPLRLVENRVADFAIVNAERVRSFTDKSDLSSIVALYKNLLYFIVPKDHQQVPFSSIVDQNVKIGYLKKDQFLIDLIGEKFHINKNKFMAVKEDNLSTSLKNKNFTAMILAPARSSLIKELLENGNLTLKSLSNKKFNQLNRSNNFIFKSTIDDGEFPSLDHSITTIGTKSVVITRKNGSKKEIYDLTNAIFSNIKKLKKLNPIYKELSKKELLEEMVLPQHEEAIRAMNGMDINSSI